MRQMVERLGVGLMVAALGACTTALPPDKIAAQGPPFNDEIRQGYVQLASAEWDEGDWSFVHFNGKAAAAMEGDAVWPDKVSSRRVPGAAIPEALAMRERLVDALEKGGREAKPVEAAAAQVNFDCWLEKLAEGSAGTDCKAAFVAALEAVEAVLTDLPDTYHVQFDPGSDFLDVIALNTITDAVRAADLLNAKHINVIGYADRSGPASLNQSLSERRAAAVAGTLVRAGIAVNAIKVDARGEGGSGADGRRVEIVLES